MRLGLMEDLPTQRCEKCHSHLACLYVARDRAYHRVPNETGWEEEIAKAHTFENLGCPGKREGK
jgi:hypothetical protein